MSKTTGFESDMTTERSDNGATEVQKAELVEDSAADNENTGSNQEGEDGSVVMCESQEAAAVDENAVEDSDDQNVEVNIDFDDQLEENTNVQDSNEKAAIRPPHPSRRTVQDLEADNKKKASSDVKSISEASQPGAFSVGSSSNNATEVESRPQATFSSVPLDYSGEGGGEETQQEEEDASDSLPQQCRLSEDNARDTSINSHTMDNTETYNSNTSRQPPVEAEEVPMIQAELVAPPIHAVQVIYDEHPEAHIDPEHGESSAMERRNRSSLAMASLDDNEDACFMDNLMSKRQQRRIGPWMCLLSVLLSIIIPVSIHFAEKNKEVETTNPASDSMETVAPSYPYECFTSTKDMIVSQIESPEQLIFIMCPHTRIKLGVLANPAANDTRIINGDAPIMVLRENIEVRCGLDGHVDNNCILEGGFVQVLLQPELLNEEEEQGVILASRRTDNVTIRGITFTGQLLSDFTLGGSSIVVSNPGQNVQMIDCLWENMTAPSGLLFVGTNPFQMYSGKGIGYLELHTASLFVINSRFRNITYDGVLAEATRQELSLKGCQFENIRLSAYASQCDYSYLLLGGDQGLAWCQGLLYCMLNSICSMEDICVQNFEYAGFAPLMVATNDSQVSLAGTVFTDNVRIPGRIRVTETCSTGLAWIEAARTGTLDCVEDRTIDSNWTRAEVCSV